MSGAKRNRHGIPILGDPPNPCRWPKCPRPAATRLNLPICHIHADIVCNAVKADRETAIRLAPPAPQPKPEKPRDEVIYFVQVGGHIKIGWTSQLDQRMRAYPPNTVLLAIHAGTRSEEKKLHQRFAVHRSHGQEWYPLVPVILDHIKRVIAEHGTPPEITFGARPVEVPTPHRQKVQMQAKQGPLLIG